MDARLVLAHIVPSNMGLIYTFPTESSAYEKDQSSFAKSELPTLVPPEYREKVSLKAMVKVGIVQDELLAMVKDENVDLVVMGTHGRNSVERFLLGSLTERMLRKVPVPILTVSHLDPAKEAPATGPVPLRKILYATDLSDNSEVGLRFSIELARGAGAALTVLHVLKPVDPLYWGAEGGYLANELESVRDDTMNRLQRSIPDEWSEGVRVLPLMVEGDPFREILRVTEEEQIDLIVMNLQGKSLIERALLGSTAERVIRSAHVPVLSIPVPAKYVDRIRKTKETAA
jgi:nucleotide-binding universal stress UspA family protein